MLRLGRRARPRRRPASPSTSAPSSATRRPGTRPIAAAAAGLRRPARRRARSPGCSTSAAASRPHLEGGCPPLAAYGAAIERSAAPALRRRAARGPSSSPAAAIVADAGDAGLDRRRRGATAATPAGSSSTPASSPGWSRPSTRRSATGCDDQRRRRPDRAVRARRADLRQRRRALRAGARCTCRSPSPRGTRSGCRPPAPTPRCYSTVGFNGFAPLPTRLVRDGACDAGPTARRLLVSHALAAVGMSLPWPLLLRAGLGAAPATARGDLLLGLTGAARMLPYVALSWATGTLADRFRARPDRAASRWSRRTVLLAGVGGRGRRGLAAGRGAAAAAAVAAAPRPTRPWPPRCPALAGPTTAPGDRPAGHRSRSRRSWSGPALGGLLLAPPTRRWVPGVAVVGTRGRALLVAGVRLPRPAAGATAACRRREPFAALRASSARRARAVAVVGAAQRGAGRAGLALLPLAEHAGAAAARATAWRPAVLGLRGAGGAAAVAARATPARRARCRPAAARRGRSRCCR